MNVTITGDLGSGKSSIAKHLREHHGFFYYSTGQILREIADERGVSILEINKQMTNEEIIGIDQEIDHKTVEMNMERPEMTVFDSRLAWHFIPDSLKVFVKIDPDIAAGRVFKAERGKTEKYGSIDEAKAGLSTRKEKEQERFMRQYGIDYCNESNYDLILDSSELGVKDLADMIVQRYKQLKGE